MVKAVTYIWENAATVQGLVGQNAAEDKYKVYPVAVPQSETGPYIIVRQSAKVAIGKGCNSFVYGIEVLSYALSYDAVTALNVAVINALQNQTPTTVNSVVYGYLNLTNEIDSFSSDHGNQYIKISTFEGTAG